MWAKKKKKNRRANRLARLARRYFSNLTAFFAFFPHCVAWGAYHLTQKSGWGGESIMVSNLPVYCRNATSVTV